jgi:hypothetical protein
MGDGSRTVRRPARSPATSTASSSDPPARCTRRPPWRRPRPHVQDAHLPAPLNDGMGLFRAALRMKLIVAAVVFVSRARTSRSRRSAA